ncbi:2-oxoglutarate dehydrogenase, E2 component, dihydrolipoamide succinyltransferase [Thalassiella azotivora]
MADVEMPALGESVTEGTVTRWLKQVGDTVEVDEPLLEVSTDKVDTEIPSPVAGTLQEILVEEDETVEVGAKLAVVGDGAPSEGSGGGGQDASQEGGDASGGDESAGEERSTEDAAQQADEPQQAQQPQETESGGSSDEGREASGGSQEQSSGGSGGQGGSGGDGGSGAGTPVTMPALGESVTEGTVTRWLKQEGDTVEVDEPLLEVSTDKVDTEIPSPVAGTIQKILVSEDETVEVGAELAVVGSGSGGGGEPKQEAPKEAPKQEAAEQDEPRQEEPKQEEPEQEEPKQEAPKQEAPKQDAPKQDAPKQDAPKQDAPKQDAPKQESAKPSGDSPSYVTPLVRKLAAEHDVDLSTLSGTGVGGRIRKQDVLEAAARKKEEAAAPAEQPAAQAPAARPSAAPDVAAKRGTTEKMSRLRKVIASRMVESLQVSAQLTTVVEVDVTKIARLRARAKADFEAREGVRLSFLPFFALATVEALKAFPVVNASIDGDEVVYHGQENLGVAVDTDRGLLVPVIKDAGDLNIAGLARKIADLAARTRDNKVTPDELGGGTFTLTNTGSRGALFDTPIINQPQVGILGTGAVVKRPVVVTDADGGETIAIRSMAYLALSYDHRLVDGADAARFLTAVKERLEEGAFDV